MQEDDKMTLLCDPKLWEDVLNRVRRKKGRRADMKAFGTCADTYGRAELVQSIADGKYELQPPRTIYKDKKADMFLSYGEAAHRNFEDVRTLYAPNNGLDGIVLAAVSQVYAKWTLAA